MGLECTRQEDPLTVYAMAPRPMPRISALLTELRKLRANSGSGALGLRHICVARFFVVTGYCTVGIFLEFSHDTLVVAPRLY